MRRVEKRVFRQTARGSALVEHGTLLGLIAVAGIGATVHVGSEVYDSFAKSGDNFSVAIEKVRLISSGVSGEGADGEGPVYTDPTRPTVPTVVAANSFDYGSGLSYEGSRIQPYVDTASFGYVSSNNEAHHFNTNTADSGHSSLNVGSDQISWPGTYEVTVVVGNFNNKPFLQMSAIQLGLESGGGYLTPTSTSMPEPALGETEVWTMTYDVTQSHIDAGIDFATDVQQLNLGSHNGSFDDLLITFIP